MSERPKNAYSAMDLFNFRAELKDQIKRYGVARLLTTLIEIVDDFNSRNEGYLKRLGDDLRVALTNYEDRYNTTVNDRAKKP